MLVFNIKPLLIARGYKPTPYLLKKLGLSNSKAVTLIHGNPKNLSLKDVEKICILLNCTPNDLLNYVPDEQITGTENYLLHTLNNNINNPNPIDILKTLNHEEMLQLNKLISSFKK
jgi:DNA-binding Xre family transcriptional regulator